MGFSIGKVFKTAGKIGRKVLGGMATAASPLAGPWAPLVAGAGQMMASSVGDSAERNAQKRADFEYARSLADQRAFQDDSVQRRVADARAAGIHPLAALGYQAPSFMPPQTSGGYGGESEYGLAEMGQDVSRAVYAAQTERERKASAATQAGIDALSMQRLGLENDNLRADLEYKRLRYMQLLRGSKPGFPDTNAIRQVGLAELGQGDYPRSLTTFMGPGGPFTVQSAETGQATENSPVSMLVAEWNNFGIPAQKAVQKWVNDHAWNYPFDTPYGRIPRAKPRRKLRPRKPRGTGAIATSGGFY